MSVKDFNKMEIDVACPFRQVQDVTSDEAKRMEEFLVDLGDGHFIYQNPDPLNHHPLFPKTDLLAGGIVKVK